MIRHDHPNLLGATLVLRFPKLCEEINRKIQDEKSKEKKILGHIFMERGGESLSIYLPPEINEAWS